jgi:hypothetical protein
MPAIRGRALVRFKQSAPGILGFNITRFPVDDIKILETAYLSNRHVKRSEKSLDIILAVIYCQHGRNEYMYLNTPCITTSNLFSLT